MKTGVKLTLGFSFIVLTMLLTVAFCLNTGKKMHEEFEALKDDIMPGALAMVQMEGASQQIAHDLMDYMVAASEEEEAVMAGLEVLTKAGTKHLEHEKHIGVDEKKEAEELMVKINRFASACTEIINLKKQGLSTAELLEKEEQSFCPTMDQLLEQIRGHKATHMEELAAAEETVHEAHVSGKRIALLVSVIVAFLAAVIAFATTRSITKPLVALHRGTEIIGSGKLDYKVATDAKDEIGQLSRAFDQMTVNLQKTTASRDELDAANQQLQASEQHLKASNQQLQASEQQLKAANQQLDASNQQLQASEQHLKATNQQLRANEEQLRAFNHHLNERSKELDCLYRVSRLATESDKTTNEFFEGVVSLIPPSWQYPEITCARIAVNGQEFMTDNFEQTIWKQSADLVAFGEKIGSVEVYYLQEKPVIDEGPFLKEERHLIDAMGRQLGIIFERKKAETEREELLGRLSRTNQDLEQSNRALQDFVYIASHDLREPLRKISSFGELLSSSLKDKLNDDEKENLGFMVDGATRMQQMIEALLTYSRVTTRGAEFETVDLNKVMEELRSVELAVKIEETGAKIATPERLHNVNCDPAQIRQLMQNLIANGLKYQKEGVVPEITIRSSVTDNDMIRVEVTDNGIGIKQEQFKDVFVMFKRLHSRREYEGAGIGLAVCKKIVERHGGDIGVSSTYGQGATFWFTLPALKTPVEKQSETSVALRV